MRSLSILDLIHHERSGDQREASSFPLNEELVSIFKRSKYALTDAQSKSGQDLVNFYKEKARPVFDTILDDVAHRDLKDDINYIVFFGQVDDGASIVVTRKKEGQIKVRVWHTKLNSLLSGSQAFFDDLSNIENAAKSVCGYDKIFAEKTIEIKIMERQEEDIVLTGTTRRLSWYKNIWAKEKVNIIISAISAILLVVTILLLVAIKAVKAEDSEFYHSAGYFVPAFIALFLNYFARVLRNLIHNEQRIKWDINILKTS